MTDPVQFDSRSPRFGLPFLFAGQAQKEAHVNEALAIADGLMHCAIEGTSETPPAEPENGQVWLVGPSPVGDWTGHAGELAMLEMGNWLFVAPRDGLRLLDRSRGQVMHFSNTWQIPQEVPEPSGGATVDAEARAAISDLVVALRVAGIFPAN